MTQDDNSATLEHQHQIQEVLDDVYERLHEKDPTEIIDAIVIGIAHAGIPPQPQKWVHDTANMLSAGPVYINGQEASSARADHPDRPSYASPPPEGPARV